MRNCRQCGQPYHDDAPYCYDCRSRTSERKSPDEFEFEPAKAGPAHDDAPMPSVQLCRPPYPSYWTRLAGVALDNIIMLIVAMPGIIVIGLAANSRGTHELMVGAGIFLALLGALAVIIYNIVSLTTKGQTIAKMMLKIRIVLYNDQQTPPGFTRTVLLRSIIPALVFCLPYLGMILFFLDNILIFREDRRCAHDLLAGTIVVRA